MWRASPSQSGLAPRHLKSLTNAVALAELLLLLSVELSKATASACQLMLSPIRACSKGILEATWWHEPKVQLQNQLRHSRGCPFQSLQVPSADRLSLELCRTRLAADMTQLFLSTRSPPALAQAMRPQCSLSHTLSISQHPNQFVLSWNHSYSVTDSQQFIACFYFILLS